MKKILLLTLLSLLATNSYASNCTKENYIKVLEDNKINYSMTSLEKSEFERLGQPRRGYGAYPGLQKETLENVQRRIANEEAKRNLELELFFRICKSEGINKDLFISQTKAQFEKNVTRKEIGLAMLTNETVFIAFMKRMKETAPEKVKTFNREIAIELAEKDLLIAKEQLAQFNIGSLEPTNKISNNKEITPEKYNIPCAENGSCYGDVSANTGKTKTTEVNGYYRKDGTYVRGHYRSK